MNHVVGRLCGGKAPPDGVRDNDVDLDKDSGEVTVEEVNWKPSKSKRRQKIVKCKVGDKVRLKRILKCFLKLKMTFEGGYSINGL